MPELPEVEVNRRGLNYLLRDKVIKEIEVYWPNIVVGFEQQPNWENQIINQRIIEIKRRGKYLIFRLNEGSIVSHLRMEGKYFYYNLKELPNEKAKHTHVIFRFKDDSELHYNDVRKFGRMEYLETDQLLNYFEARQIGPEPVATEFKLDEFSEQLNKSKQNIKAALLSQKYVAGLGNIYVDEVLFRTGIHPLIKADKLNKQQVKALYSDIIKVIEEAIEAGGSSIRTYRNTVGESGNYQKQLKVYGRTNEPCVKCQTPIEKIRVAQRGTHICPRCQVII